MRRIGYFLVTILMASAYCAAADIYVSPTGDDANPGTADKPIRTLAHARDLVRNLNQNMTGDVTVELAGGVYRLSEPLQLTAADSGSNGHNVIYAAHAGDQVVISGGVAITGWKQIDAAKNLWSAPAPDGLVNTRQMYVNGVRAWRTRGFLPTRLTETPTGYEADSDAMANWKNPSDIEFVYTGGNALWGVPSVGLGAWTEPRCPVASISGTTITMAEPCWTNSTKRVDLPERFHSTRKANLVGPGSVGKQPYYVENAYELLGTPGQWYFDRPGKTIYYVPRTGEDLTSADVEAGGLETLVSGNGTEQNPIHNIVFRGLQFSYATWLYPSTPEGFSEIQANFMVTGPDGYDKQGLGDLAPGGMQPFGAWTPTPGNLAFSYDRQIRFERDAFVHLGGAGLALGDGSQGDSVVGCVFTDISANGLELGNVDLPEFTADQATTDNTIANNYFHDLPVEYHGGVAIDVGYTQRSHIEHNQVEHVAYSGISLGWGGWPDKIALPGVANNSNNVAVANNLIFDHMLLLADGGGIYTQGLTGPSLADGEKVTGNVVRDQFSSGHAIYSDNGSANMIITGNVMFHDNMDNWGSAHANYYDGNAGKTRDPFDIEDNYWQQGNPDSSRQNVTMKGNHLIAALTDVPSSVLQEAGIQADYADILTEKFASGAPESPSRVGAADAGKGSALVTWNPPIFEGGAPIQSYTVTSSTGQSVTITADDFHTNAYAKITGLPDGACRFTVTASNANGSSPPSLPSPQITPGGREISPPDAPTVQAAYAADGKISVHFMSPEEDGGSPVYAYEFTVNPGGKKFEMTGRIPVTLSGRHASFYVIDGLDSGTTYTVDVAAVNAAGEGEASKTRAVTVK
ncbi:MAG TPA: fibronectin type III domain-containing protein [Tepidisphaeraceae bacterium]|nr:fibronectin type III domain-containing protein [Tepidisphaeraceae bacterium]